MNVVMTLLVRDEADIVDAHIAYHLRAGVDFVIATDNRSQDATTEILERYEAQGCLHLIREPGDDLRQSEWVTRMARLAATEFDADWVINSDVDEFWFPREGSLKDVLATVPERYGVVHGAWRVFVPRPDDTRFFAERMTVRLRTPAYHDHPFSTDRKSVHRAAPDVRVGRGNHEAFAERLLPLRGWFPIEVLHFPIRSLEQCTRKYVTQFLALERNAEKGTPGVVADAYGSYIAGRPEGFYEPFVVDDAELELGLDDGTLAVDTRLRDVLRTLAPREDVGVARFSQPSRDEPALTFARPNVIDRTLYAAETTVIPEADLAQSLGARIEEMETRVDRMDGSGAARLKSIFSRGRS